MRWAALAGSLLLAAADPPPQAIVNAGFDQPEVQGFPTGWRLRARGSATGPNLVVSAIREGGTSFARATAADPTLIAATRMMQTIDATEWRGRHVRLSARFRVRRPGTLVGLLIDVRRPEPWPNGFFDNMYDRPIGAGDWKTVTLDAYVEPDATAIDLGITAAGPVDFDVDDFAITEATLDPRPASPAARAYLDTAIDALRAKHIRSKEIDWPTLRTRVQAEIGGAQLPADTYRAIRSAFGTMGDNHASLRPPEPAVTAGATTAPGARTPPRQPLPSYRWVDGRFGMVTLPGLSINTEADRAHGAAYVATLREGLGIFDRMPVCGWIVDLRPDTGGNMWPMLNGLTPLLGPAPFGYFVTPDGATTPWILHRGIVTLPGMPAKEIAGASPWSMRHGALPVAVLIGPATSSSGEATAIALSGRANARSFGQQSGGYTSANEGHRLPDGAMMFVPSSWERDRTGRDFRAKITPDEVTAPGAELAAARAWLASRCAQ